MVAGKTMFPGWTRTKDELNMAAIPGFACGMHKSKGGVPCFVYFIFKNMQNLDTFEHGGYHVLYVMCKTHQPGVHQVAHDGPDGITTCS